MKKEQIKNLYKEYVQKFDEIIEIYGDKDGFVINGEKWWDYYKTLINKILSQMNSGKFTEKDASNFYKQFGFGPKLYGRSFIEEGMDKIISLFHYLIDDSISVNDKIKQIVEEPESEHFFKGIGINFVTLFLTSYFPTKYVQWNRQTDGGLNILDAYPKRKRGESKSDFYIKINNVCLDIAKILDIKSLPIIDNFLYCLNKGYIGNPEKTEKILEKTTRIILEEEKTEKKDKHLEIMYYLVKIGLIKNYNVWVATNDRNKKYKEIYFQEVCLPEIPNFTQPDTLAIAKYIDVIWFKKNTSFPVRFFEIEHTTSIYSGLLRLNDVRIDYPITKATIVLPEKRLDIFEKQIERRTFKFSELYEICDYMTYEDLKKWFNAVKIDSKYS